MYEILYRFNKSMRGKVKWTMYEISNDMKWKEGVWQKCWIQLYEVSNVGRKVKALVAMFPSG